MENEAKEATDIPREGGEARLCAIQQKKSAEERQKQHGNLGKFTLLFW
jgi:hypothetical protein